MPFTEEEERLWHQEKQRREYRPPFQPFRSPPVATCVHCHNPFGRNEGFITPEVAICHRCNGD